MEPLQKWLDNRKATDAFLQGGEIWQKWQETGSPNDLADAKRLFEQSVELSSVDHSEWPKRVYCLVITCWKRWANTKIADDLEIAIKYCKQLIDRSPPASHDMAENVGLLACIYLDRQRYTGSTDDLEASISLHQQVLNLKVIEQTNPARWTRQFKDLRRGKFRTEVTYANRAHRTNDLGKLYSTRYESSNNIEDLDASIRCFWESFTLTTTDEAEHVSLLHSLALAHRRRFIMNGDREDGNTAIDLWRTVLKTIRCPEDEAQAHFGLAITYESLWTRHASEDDRCNALRHFQHAIDLVPADHSTRATYLVSLSLMYEKQYGRTNTIEDLEQAVNHAQEALVLNHHDNHLESMLILRLSMRYFERHLKTKDLDDLQTGLTVGINGANSISLLNSSNAGPSCNGISTSNDQEILEKITKMLNRIADELQDMLSTPDDLDQTSVLQSRGVDHYKSYLAGYLDWPSITLSIKFCQAALDQTPLEHPDRAARLFDLAMAYYCRQNRSGALADIEKSMDLFNESASCTPLAPSQRLKVFDMLGQLDGLKYMHTRNYMDLVSAIRHCSFAISLVPKDHPDRAEPLITLAWCHRTHYEEYSHKDALPVLSLAIKCAEEALELAERDNYCLRARITMVFALCMMARFLHTGNFHDHECAMQRIQQLIDESKPDDPWRAEAFGQLGSLYYAKYTRTKVRDDLDQGIQSCQQALALVPVDHPAQAPLLATLARTKKERYRQTGATIDLHDSIELLTEALKLVGPDHLNRQLVLSVLSEAYRDRYLNLRTHEDLDTAIRHAQEADSYWSLGDPFRAKSSRLLASLFMHKYHRDHNWDDLTTAVVRCEWGMSDYLSPWERLLAGRAAISLHCSSGNWLEAYKLSETVISVIPLMVSQSAESADNQHLATLLAGTSSDAAAIALRAGQLPHRAISFLEIGRGFIANAIADLRREISILDEQHPDIAAQLHLLRSLLDTPRASRGDQQRFQVGEELQKLVQDIRKLPGFERFLMGPSEDDIRAVATYDPIVMINANKYGCHALIVEQKGIRSLALPLLRCEEIQVRLHAVHAGNVEVELLEWLWLTIACPILEALGFQRSSQKTWPRVHWIPIGPLARFPIHAAGRYTSDTQETVLDRVISSYSVSLRALVDGRQISSPPDLNVAKRYMVLIAAGQTAGNLPLAHAENEVEAVAEIGRAMNLDTKHASGLVKEDVVSLINQGCHIFHFAGHADADQMNPLKSTLILPDAKLTVGDLLEANLSLQKPFLAYLSACGTGQVKHERLIDEGIHLIGACLLAGFQHTIGTLWEVNDEMCVSIAQDTYSWIRDKGMSNDSVSEGLHHAIRAARGRWTDGNANGPLLESKIQTGSNVRKLQEHRNNRTAEALDDIPMTWVPYVHFGN